MTDFAKFEKDGWSEPSIARSYADFFAAASEMCVPALVTSCGAARGSKAIDLCCGQGIVAAGLVNAGAETIGVDFSPAMLDMARARVPGASFAEGDAMALNYEDGTFDCATIGFGILHVPDAGAALVETARVLKPGGKVSWTCWHGPEKRSVLPTFFAAAIKHGDPSVEFPPSPPAFHYAQPKNATPIMEAAGFADIEFETVDSFWMCERSDDPVTYFGQGAVRGAGLMSQQPAENRTRITKAVSDWVEETCPRDVTGRWKVPIPAAVVSGRKT